jgi:YaiO family outer membrane protein
LALTAWTGACAAQTSAPATAGTIEAGILRHGLTDGYGDWRHVFVRGNLRTSADNMWDAEIVRADRFNETGTAFVLGNTHQFNDRWYGNFGVSSSSGGSFLPSWRVDMAANRKWLAGSNLITTVGFTAVEAKDYHSERSILLALTYYLPTYPVVVQTGMRTSRSDPGSVISHSGYAAVTYGYDKKHLISLMHSRGGESYQIIGLNALLVDFHSSATTATWRQWVRPNAGFLVRAEAYRNPFYRRSGLEVAVFREF